jgi:hypothetical protein
MDLQIVTNHEKYFGFFNILHIISIFGQTKVISFNFYKGGIIIKKTEICALMFPQEILKKEIDNKIYFYMEEKRLF